MNLTLPAGKELKDFLQLSSNANIDDLIKKSLTDPLKSMMSRPRKGFRGALVEFSFSVAKEQNLVGAQDLDAAANCAATILEILHTGSLVIDDIQDGSQERRGAPSAHRLYGIPVALNLGNWLYFFPSVLIERMPIPESYKPRLFKEIQNTLLKAHYGQALDVGISFDSVEQARLKEISGASRELKTGALSALANKIGVIAYGADERTVSAMGEFGRNFGIALQMYDDIGNLSAHDKTKWMEDLQLKRITYVIATAAEIMSKEEFTKLVSLVNDNALVAAHNYLIEMNVIRVAQQNVKGYIDDSISTLQKQIFLSQSQIEFLQNLKLRLMKAYG